MHLKLFGAFCLTAPLLIAPLATAETVKFGFVMPFSGWFEPIDAANVKGARLAVKEINSQGGLLGKQIEVIDFDTKSEPELGADGAIEVISKGAQAIMVASDFDFGAPGAFIAQQQGVISFAGAADPRFGVQGIGNLAYSMSNSVHAQAFLLANWADKQQGWETAYILFDDTLAMTKSLCGTFNTHWQELKGKQAILGSDSFLNADPSIDAQVSRIKALPVQPDVIMLCSYAPGGPSAIRQLRAGGVEAPILSGESMDGDYWVDVIPNLSDFYVAAFGSIYGDDSDPEIVNFFNRYEAEYGERADVSYALRGYSIIQAWANAVNKAGTSEPAEVAKMLNTFRDEPLLIGPTTYTDDLHLPLDRPMAIIESQGGKFNFLTKTAPQERGKHEVVSKALLEYLE